MTPGTWIACLCAGSSLVEQFGEIEAQQHLPAFAGNLERTGERIAPGGKQFGPHFTCRRYCLEIGMLGTGEFEPRVVGTVAFAIKKVKVEKWHCSFDYRSDGLIAG